MSEEPGMAANRAQVTKEPSKAAAEEEDPSGPVGCTSTEVMAFKLSSRKATEPSMKITTKAFIFLLVRRQ